MRVTVTGVEIIAPAISRVKAHNTTSDLSVDLHSEWYDPRKATLDVRFERTAHADTDELIMHGTVAQREGDTALVSNGGLFVRVTGALAGSLSYGDDVYTVLSQTAPSRRSVRKRSVPS